MKNPHLFLIAVVLTVFACNSGAPSESAPAEQPKKASQPRTKISEIEAGIKAHIEAKSQENDGFFLVQDKDKRLRMKLVRVHTEYLSNLGPKRHFACVDLADDSGDVYDVDFFLSGEPGNMDVTETTIHKLNGKPFYAWKQKEDKTWERRPVEGASRELLGVIEGKDKFEFHYLVVLPKLASSANMWIPIATSDEFQKITVKSLKTTGTQEMFEDKANGNTILHLALEPQHSGDTVKIIYTAERVEKGPFVDNEPDLQRYLTPNELIPVGGRFLKIAQEAIGAKHSDNKLVQARALYDYIIDNMRYMKHGNYGHGDAVYACDTRTGNCSEFHSFFISLARSVGIPARFAIGASIPSDRDDGGIDGYHCWAEFYAEGKWWPVDISEGNKYTALATYYFGRHPANRIELSRGRDLQVEPLPASGPINFLAYPLLEIGGEPTRAETVFTFKRIISPETKDKKLVALQ